ncbi:MAG TPA: TolC family outer membrane protein [Caulobacteraceae bacterium]|nr:TolC family outer membrane protein [Caulobacteraceae bacterium]
MRALGRAARAGCIAMLAAVGAGQPAAAETLTDAVALAYQTNPTLQSQRAQLRATDEEWVQAEAGLRPTVSVTGSYQYQHEQISVGGTSLSATVAGPTGNAIVTVNQPIYTGGAATAKIDAAQADILAGREGLRRTEISVLQSVVGAYLDVRRDQEQLAISQDNVNVLARQLEETTAKFNAGVLTRTDLAQSQARLAQARSQLAAAQSTLAQARAGYAAVVGQNPGELAPEPPIAALLPPSVDAAFDAAERDNPQLRQATYAEEASAARLAQQKAQMRPTVSVQGQYGYVGALSSTGFGGAATFLESETGGVVSANVSVPVFAGGLYASQIRQAAEQDNVNRIGVEGARRDVLQAVSQSWNQLLGARASLAADEEQVKSDTVAYEGVREEQKVGLRTILDVLNAQQELEQSQLALVGARHDEYVAAAAVLAAMGALEARNLIPNEPRYDPKVNADRVRHAVGWVPWEGAVGAIDRLGGPKPTPAPPPSPPGEVVKTGAPGSP